MGESISESLGKAVAGEDYYENASSADRRAERGELVQDSIVSYAQKQYCSCNTVVILLYVGTVQGTTL